MQTSFRETYSLLKNDWVVDMKFDSFLGFNDTIIESDPLNINNLVQINDDLNCYVEDDNQTVILKANESLGRFKEVVFHRLYLIYEAYFYHDGNENFPISYLPKTINTTSFYLCCNQLANSSKIALINDDDTYKSESVAYVNDNKIDCYFMPRINSNIIVSLYDLLNAVVTNLMKNIVTVDIYNKLINQYPMDMNFNIRTKVKIKDIVIDAEWKL